MKIGYSYWGYCEDIHHSDVVHTPDGGRFTRPIFVRELVRHGHSVIALQQQRENIPIKEILFDNSFPDIDALFIEWRWSTYKNDINHPNYIAEKFEPDLCRQRSLLDFYHDKIPIAVWDTDLKVTIKDKSKWPNVIWTEPTIKHDDINCHTLLYFTDSVMLFKSIKPIDQYTYIGSNYERYNSVDKYYYNIGKQLSAYGIKIEFYGNWLEKSIERPEQEKMIKKYSKFINFHRRNTMFKGMTILNASICVTHIVKNLYYQRGLITPRFFECLAMGTPGLIPEEFVYPLYGKEWLANSKNIISRILTIRSLSVQARQDLAAYQLKNITELFPQTMVENHVNDLIALFRK